MPKFVDITGQKFNLLTAVKRSDKQIDGNVRWDCVCDCGNNTWVIGARLRTGITRSCGCLAKSNARGHSNPTHGMASTSEYRAWCDAKFRCNNPSDPQYEYYGGRGIQMQDDWQQDFSKFIEYIGRKPSSSHSLDRIDNDLDYCEGNVRWATKKEQVTNRGSHVNNKTGHCGVALVVNPENGYEHYKAFWGSKGDKHCRSFSVTKYGKEVALQMAIAARESGIESIRQADGYTEKHGQQRKNK